MSNAVCLKTSRFQTPFAAQLPFPVYPIWMSTGQALSFSTVLYWDGYICVHHYITLCEWT